MTSSKLRQFLEMYKIPSNKKLNAPYINCCKNEKHFVRGLLDGDGCLYYNYVSGKLKHKRLELSTASPYIKIGYCNFLKSMNIPYTIYEDSNLHICYKIFIDKIDDIIKLLDYLYEDKGQAFLDRKYITFIKFKKLVDMNRQVNDIVGSNCNELE